MIYKPQNIWNHRGHGEILCGLKKRLIVDGSQLTAFKLSFHKKGVEWSPNI
jgi:hypothetical protein